MKFKRFIKLFPSFHNFCGKYLNFMVEHIFCRENLLGYTKYKKRLIKAKNLRRTRMTYNKKKFKDLVHYICEKAKDPSVLGGIKLNKVLYYSDVIYYMLHAKPITGETYIKRQFGPVPRHIMPIIEELIAERKIARGKQDYFGRMKTEFIAITECDLSSFSADEISLVDDAFEHVCLNHTASSVSEETHNVIWKLANMGEEIPYFTVFASQVDEVYEEDIQWAESFIKIAA